MPRFPVHSRGSLIAILCVVLIHGVLAYAWVWNANDGQGWKEIIRSDAKGYYAYLPALFIHHDLGHEKPAWEYVQHTPTGTVNKYFCGTAVMMAPWFAIGHGLALLDPDAKKDGTSAWEYIFISVGALVYELLALLLLRSFFHRFDIRDAIIAWLVVVLGLGTTLLQYAAIQPGWSHVYSFFLVSALMWVLHHLYTSEDRRSWFLVAGIMGLLVLIRPVNALVLLAVPVVFGDRTLPLLKRLFASPKHLLGALLIGSVVVSLQLLLWYVQNGDPFARGYQGEGFHWDRPQVFNVLFGFRRGIFLWTPVVFLAALSAIPLLWRDPWRGWGLLLYWSANTYVISSWWIWYYGSGFANRVFIDHYPVLFLPFAFLLNSLQGKRLRAMQTLLVALIALHLFQFWQAHKGIIHNDSMDHRKYAWAFGKWNVDAGMTPGGNYQTAPYNPKGMELVLTSYTNLEDTSAYWHGGDIREHPNAHSGKRVCVYEPGTEFGVTFTAPPGTLPIGRALHMEVSMFRFEPKAGSSQDMLGIASVEGPDGSMVYYDPFHMNMLPGETDSTWAQQVYAIQLPPLDSSNAVRLYFWAKEKRSHVLLDDLRVKIHAVIPY